MRTVLVLAALVALASASVVPNVGFPKFEFTNVKTVAVDDVTMQRQHLVLELFEDLFQVNSYAGYYKIGKEYNIKANIDKYEKKEVVEKFYKMYEKDFLPKYADFSIFNEKMRAQAIALFDLFFYAKDFETYYNTAAWARVYLNEGMFAYSFYVAAIQRLDTKNLVLPAFYEIYPEFFTNTEVFSKMYYSKMRGLPFEEYPEYGVIEQGDYYYYYANYSDYTTYGQNEYKLAYLTEDIGWNSFYSYFHAIMPFWRQGDDLFGGLFKGRRGEIYYHFYQQLLARYYLERLSNGLGEIPKFSWYQPYHYGFRPYLSTAFYPFAQRNDEYSMQTPKNLDDLRYIRNYEDEFLTFLEKGQFKAYNQEVDFYNSKSINWVGNFWQANPDLYEKVGYSNYHASYEMAARRVLGGAPYQAKGYKFVPTAMDYYITSLRDPAFYQIYNKIVGFMLQYKKYLQPYSQDYLHYIGVKINKVEVSKLTTFFEFSSFNATNAIYKSNSELSAPVSKSFMVMQPRLNHEAFTLKINVKSDVEETATFKVFVGPKYDGKGYPIKFEDNWMNFVELDWFNHKLTKGENVIERSSEDFFHFKEDSLPIKEIYKLLGEKKLPVSMVEDYDNLPRRLMLPRGTNGGFPLQFFVFAYPSESLPKELEAFKDDLIDSKPFGYPFDRPVSDFFWQPNMYIQDALVYHKGYEYPYYFNSLYHSNEVTKH